MEDYSSYFTDLIDSIIGTLPEVDDDSDPFSFDEKLAKESSTAEYEPYYSNLLKNFVEDQQTAESRGLREKEATENIIGTKKAEAQTEATKGMSYLKDINTITRQQSDLQYQQAIQAANQGYAGKGLYFSGMRQRDLGTMGQQQQLGLQQLGLTEAENTRKIQAGLQSTLGNLGEATRQNTTGYEDLLKDLGTAKTRYTKDIEDQKKAAIEQGVLQRRQEALQNYAIERGQTFM